MSIIRSSGSWIFLRLSADGEQQNLRWRFRESSERKILRLIVKKASLRSYPQMDADGYSIIVDTHGSLLWEKENNPEKPHLIITSAQVSKAYLEYLDGQNISWIACGDNHIDLARAAEILNQEFGVKRMGVVGGPGINTGFLNVGLLDEIDILIGPGIDGRAEMPSIFEGRDNPKPLPLKLKNVKPYNDGTVLLAYSV